MEKYRGKYRIPSARAGWWDYSADGSYFITICTAGHECLLGEIINYKMILSDIGRIVQEEWDKSFELRKELYCDAFVIMPNHIHAVLFINNPDYNKLSGFIPYRTDAVVRMPQSISTFVGGFKAAVTTRLKQQPHLLDGRKSIWQTRFHDHIIRNEKEYKRIVDYINNNPYKWTDDRYFPTPP